MRKPADTDREFERLFQAAPPRLEVGVAQPMEPGVIGTKSVELLEEPERLQQRKEGMRDRRVSPIDDAEPTVVCIEVCHVEVVVLDRFLDSELSQHGAEFGEARRVIPQAVDVIYREWELAREQTLITRRQRSHAQIRHAVGDVIEGVCRLSFLQLGIRRQCLDPRLGRITQLPDGDACVAEQKPAPHFVYGKHLAHAVGPSSVELSGQPRLECLNLRARLEPRRATRDRHPHDFRPGPIVSDFDGTDRLDVAADPLFSADDVQRSSKLPSATGICRPRRSYSVLTSRPSTTGTGSLPVEWNSVPSGRFRTSPNFAGEVPVALPTLSLKVPPENSNVV